MRREIKLKIGNKTYPVNYFNNMNKPTVFKTQEGWYGTGNELQACEDNLLSHGADIVEYSVTKSAHKVMLEHARFWEDLAKTDIARRIMSKDSTCWDSDPRTYHPWRDTLYEIGRYIAKHKLDDMEYWFQELSREGNLFVSLSFKDIEIVPDNPSESPLRFPRDYRYRDKSTSIKIVDETSINIFNVYDDYTKYFINRQSEAFTKNEGEFLERFATKHNLQNSNWFDKDNLKSDEDEIKSPFINTLCERQKELSDAKTRAFDNFSKANLEITSSALAILELMEDKSAQERLRLLKTAVDTAKEECNDFHEVFMSDDSETQKDWAKVTSFNIGAKFDKGLDLYIKNVIRRSTALVKRMEKKLSSLVIPVEYETFHDDIRAAQKKIFDNRQAAAAASAAAAALVKQQDESKKYSALERKVATTHKGCGCTYSKNGKAQEKVCYSTKQKAWDVARKQAEPQRQYLCDKTFWDGKNHRKLGVYHNTSK
jgi:hypothetical protein